MTVLQPVSTPSTTRAAAAPRRGVRWLHADLATYLVVFIIYSNAAVIAVRFHGMPFIVAAGIPLLLGVPLLYYLLQRRQELVITPVTLLALAFLLVELLGTLFSKYVDVAAQNVLTFASEGLAIYLLLTNVIRHPRTLRGVLWAVLLAGILMATFPIIQYATGTYDSNYGGFAQADGAGVTTGQDLFGDVRQLRVAGVIGEKNFYAQMMLMVVPIGVMQASAEKSWALRALALLSAGMSAAAVALTFSRGAAVGFVVMLLVAVFMRAVTTRQFAVIVLVAAVLLAMFPVYASRVMSVLSVTTFVKDDAEVQVDRAIEGRLTEMVVAARIFADYPWVGVGPGVYKYYSRAYSNEVGLLQLTGTREAHSLYLALAADTGLPGILAFLAIAFTAIFDLGRVRRQFRSTNRAYANMSSGVLLGLVSYLTTGIFLHMAYERYFWLMLGIAVAAANIARNWPPDSVSTPSTAEEVR
ncbi:MAG TPA: O-antigen ligase family protein [Aggregatilineales bacterium]|nr:O-antigen ligase family protein [Aggregatilineales bacterium]